MNTSTKIKVVANANTNSNDENGVQEVSRFQYLESTLSKGGITSDIRDTSDGPARQDLEQEPHEVCYQVQTGRSSYPEVRMCDVYPVCRYERGIQAFQNKCPRRPHMNSKPMTLYQAKEHQKPLIVTVEQRKLG